MRISKIIQKQYESMIEDKLKKGFRRAKNTTHKHISRHKIVLAEKNAIH